MHRITVALVAAAVTLTATPRARATTAINVCSANADPCNLTADLTVDDQSVLDFGNRALVIKNFKHLNVGSGTMTIKARTVDVLPGGAIQGVSDTRGGVIFITTTGALNIKADGGTKGRIDVSSAGGAGEVHITAGADVVIDGALAAAAADLYADGGILELTTPGNLALNGDTTVEGGAQGGAGSIAFTAGGSITASTAINAAGGELDGGDVDLEATGDITTTSSLAKIDVSGAGLSGSGGFVSLIGRNVSLAGPIVGGAAGSTEEGGGSAAEIDITAEQKVTLGEQLNLLGPAPDGEGGSLDLDAGTDAVQTAPILAAGVGIDACGGDIALAAVRNLSLNVVDVTGGSCGDGSFFGSAGGILTVPSSINADASSTGPGGSIALLGESLSVSANLTADGGFGGGLINLQGCTVNVASGVSITTQGSNGENKFQASGVLTLRGPVVSGGTNRIEYRDPSKPPVTGSASFTPPPQVVINPDLPPCQQIQVVCGNNVQEPGEECDDGNTVACDGCSAACTSEGCGNGVIECDEQCDDGPLNGTPGSQCDTSCHPVVLPVRFIVGGPKSKGCLLEWAVVNPGSAIKKGFPAHFQECIDGDPGCDADGENNNECSFTVSACLNVTDSRLPTCLSPGVATANLRRPNFVQPPDAIDQDNATRLVSAIGALGVTVKSGSTVVQSGAPDTHHDHCTPGLALRVPHAPGRIGRRILAAGAIDPSGHSMRSNRVRFACLPNPAVCGNGVLETPGEQCDDGNTVSCDGCSDKCRTEVCGNGKLECSEQCDDGVNNGKPGDPCSANCTETPPALRIPGGGAAVSDCLAEWSLAIAQPTLDRHGRPTTKQVCVDDDPSCDFDPTPGSCRFHVWQCLGADDSRIACTAATASSAEVLRPPVSQTGPPAVVRQAMLAAFSRLTFPIGPGEVCTRRVDVDVPAGKRRFVLRTRARRPVGASDSDVLQLLCMPPAAP